MSIANRIIENDDVPRLLQRDNFVGWIYRIDYESAYVMTNDIWKARVSGVLHNSFLLAASFDPARYSEANEIQREVILLRVVGSATLLMDDDLVTTRIEHFQER